MSLSRTWVYERSISISLDVLAFEAVLDDGFDDDSITLASAMTYNELGLVKNEYDGGYKYGDTVSVPLTTET